MTRRNLFSFEPTFYFLLCHRFPQYPAGSHSNPASRTLPPPHDAPFRRRCYCRCPASARPPSAIAVFCNSIVLSLPLVFYEHFEMVEDVESKPESFNSCCKVWKDLCTKLEEKRIALRQATKLLNEQCKRIEVENRNLKKGRFKSKEVIGDTSLARKSDNQGQWVIRNAEVATTNFESLWIVTKVFAFDDWQMIRKSLEEYFQAKIVINPLFGENAFISIDQDSIKDRICEEGKWQAMGEARIQVKQNCCGFVPSTIEITNVKRGNIFSNFGDFGFCTLLCQLVVLLCSLMVKHFTNPTDLLRIRKVLQDEDLYLSTFPPVLKVSKSTFPVLPIARNLFEALKILQECSLTSRKMAVEGSQADMELIAPENEKASSLDIAKPVTNSCLDKVVGPTMIDSPFKMPVFEGLRREKDSKKAPLIKAMREYKFSTGFNAANSPHLLHKHNDLHCNDPL
ncbi:kinesin heavy chain-like [Cucumis melo var. makuwa]|uniref:Kinesin heavy chain-like n=1 Tax=Cucumis melo var. makuwa TaxID=1194695 RepID=A0A5D3BNW8_CUCMM|nr:kinesin heavy chain-like [Cucumis melo var. makuwa]